MIGSKYWFQVVFRFILFEHSVLKYNFVIVISVGVEDKHRHSARKKKAEHLKYYSQSFRIFHSLDNSLLQEKVDTLISLADKHSVPSNTDHSIGSLNELCSHTAATPMNEGSTLHFYFLPVKSSYWHSV